MKKITMNILLCALLAIIIVTCTSCKNKDHISYKESQEKHAVLDINFINSYSNNEYKQLLNLRNKILVCGNDLYSLKESFRSYGNYSEAMSCFIGLDCANTGRWIVAYSADVIRLFIESNNPHLYLEYTETMLSVATRELNACIESLNIATATSFNSSAQLDCSNLKDSIREAIEIIAKLKIELGQKYGTR